MSSDISPDCPFCNIVQTYKPVLPNDPKGFEDLDSSTSTDSSHPQSSPTAYVLFSTPHALAFLDILPLTRGHVLLIPRRHAAKMGDMRPGEAAELGRILPLVARAVTRAVLPDIQVDNADYNIVQNNGRCLMYLVQWSRFNLIIPLPFA